MKKTPTVTVLQKEILCEILAMRKKLQKLQFQKLLLLQRKTF